MSQSRPEARHRRTPPRIRPGIEEKAHAGPEAGHIVGTRPETRASPGGAGLTHEGGKAWIADGLMPAEGQAS